MRYHKYQMAEEYEHLEWGFLRIQPLDKKLLRKLSKEIDSSINF